MTESPLLPLIILPFLYLLSLSSFSSLPSPFISLALERPSDLVLAPMLYKRSSPCLGRNAYSGSHLFFLLRRKLIEDLLQ